MIRSRLLSVLAAGASLACLGGVLAAPAAAQQSDGQHGSHHGSRLPAHLFTPYFESYTTDSPAALAQQSGAKFLTMAFLQTPAVGSCTVHWNGNPATPVAPA